MLEGGSMSDWQDIIIDEEAEQYILSLVQGYNYRQAAVTAYRKSRQDGLSITDSIQVSMTTIMELSKNVLLGR